MPSAIARILKSETIFVVVNSCTLNELFIQEQSPLQHKDQ